MKKIYYILLATSMIACTSNKTESNMNSEDSISNATDVVANVLKKSASLNLDDFEWTRKPDKGNMVSTLAS